MKILTTAVSCIRHDGKNNVTTKLFKIQDFKVLHSVFLLENEIYQASAQCYLVADSKKHLKH